MLYISEDLEDLRNLLIKLTFLASILYPEGIYDGKVTINAYSSLDN